MTETAEKASIGDKDANLSRPTKQQRRHRLRKVLWIIVFLGLPLLIARAAMPDALRWYVNRTIDQSPLYQGRVGRISIHLWRGAYTISDVRIVKRQGNIPVPFFSAARLDLAIQWKHLMHGKIVGRVLMEKPELNFVDAPGQSSDDQTGVGPWLQIIRELFPFKINSAEIKDGAIHFRAYQVDPPVDVYMSRLDATIDNLTNIYDETTPLVSTVSATALAMDQAKLQYKMKLDPFSYRPSFQMAAQLIGLDVQKLNNLTRSYGKFDFEHGWFDLVVEVDSKEGRMEGYVKPLFRNLRVFTSTDLKEDNVLELFVEAVVGVATGVLKNPPRDQFGTVIPFKGTVEGPSPDLLASVGNVLYNAFVRAYLPKLEGVASNESGLKFEKGSIVEPTSVGDTR